MSDRDDNIEPTGDDTGDNRTNGIAIGFGLVVVIILIIWAADAIQSATTTTATVPAQCTASCHVFLEWECPTKKFMGACPSFWTDCDPNRGHVCLAQGNASPIFAAVESGDGICRAAGRASMRAPGERISLL